ncbi:MAG: S41 family peptidase [Oscillospiraceae bacterium]|nr:S41 family peptidase [Oscillospiraceae bacterium]
MENKLSLKVRLVLMLLILALICALAFLFVMFFTGSDRKSDAASPDGTDITSVTGDMEELLAIIASRFIGDYDIDELLEIAKIAIVDALDDNWSFYMTPEAYAYYLENSDNRYHGIGVEVQTDDERGGILVTNVYSNSGAEAAGIVIGDVITKIDNAAIAGYDMQEIRNALRRPIGDTALLTIYRADGSFSEITVVYGIIHTIPVAYEMLPGGIGYVALGNFEDGAAQGFIEAVNNLVDRGAVAIIYDVRSNNGGKVTEMTEILDFLLPEGEIFISISTDQTERITTSDSSFIDLPTVVLVNEYSYSGAEYFTAVLSEYDYALTVGEQTTGKNRMQTTITLSGGGAVHLSTGNYLTPNRISLYDIGGYTPDYLVKMSEDELISYLMGTLTHEDDPQLQKALSLLTD